MNKKLIVTLMIILTLSVSVTPITVKADSNLLNIATESIVEKADIKLKNEIEAEESRIQAEFEAKQAEEKQKQEDLYWLSRLIYAESGSDQCTDKLQLYVGSVILNRKNNNLYPNTIKEVIFDTHWGRQYGCVTNKMIYNEPNERAIKSAAYLLDNGSVLPDNVLGQSNVVLLNGKYCEECGVIFSKL